jgi:hypothetical protein
MGSNQPISAVIVPRYTCNLKEEPGWFVVIIFLLLLMLGKFEHIFLIEFRKFNDTCVMP